MKRFLLLAATAAFVFPANAQIGIAVRVGTLGPGVDVAYSVNPKLTVRASGSYLALSRTESFDEEDFTADLDGDVTVGAMGVLLDFHPFESGLRLTGGLTANLFEVSGVGTPTEAYCFGDGDISNCSGKVFSPDRLGNFGASVAHASSMAPYGGIGFGSVAGGSRVGFVFDLGVLYTGSPEIDLEASGLLAPTASPEQEAELNAGIESFQFYPVLSLGLAIRL